MFKSGDVIDDKYRVDDLCSDTGGMGVILFVSPIEESGHSQLVLKYCRQKDEVYLKRFIREVRLLSQFKDNSKVVQLVYSNLDYDPPYFVMKYYPKGDLSNEASDIQQNNELQEKRFFEMIDCISELHLRGYFHRDIKPQNFLIDEDNIVVSDFGLSMEVDSNTRFTRTSDTWGTPGYLPPEFEDGGFKHADAAGDIFMLGKSFYVLLTGKGPLYLNNDGIPAPVFHIIKRCCDVDKTRRYQSFEELKQSLKTAYDILMNRTDVPGKSNDLLTTIMDHLNKDNSYNSADITQFIENLSLMDRAKKIKVCFEIDRALFRILKEKSIIAHLEDFLSSYNEMVTYGDYDWGYAETIAFNMSIIFYGNDVPNNIKAKALEIAIEAANRMNRYAAMNTCKEMIQNVRNEGLGQELRDVILKNKRTFISDIDESECQSRAIQLTIIQINKRDDSKQ